MTYPLRVVTAIVAVLIVMHAEAQTTRPAPASPRYALKADAPDDVRRFWDERETIRTAVLDQYEAIIQQIEAQLAAARLGSIRPAARGAEFAIIDGKMVAQFDSLDQRTETVQYLSFARDKRTGGLKLERAGLVAYPFPTARDIKVGWIGRLHWGTAHAREVIDKNNVVLDLVLPEQSITDEPTVPIKLWLTNFNTSGLRHGHNIGLEITVRITRTRPHPLRPVDAQMFEAEPFRMEDWVERKSP